MSKERKISSTRKSKSRLLRDPSATMLVRLVGPPTTTATTAGGVIAGFHSADPSGGGTWTATEWADITAMYSEVRMISFTLNFVPPAPADTTINANLGNYLAVSGVLSTVVANPASYVQVFDNADAKAWCMLSDRSRFAYAHTIKPKRPLNWAVVTIANPGSYAGCPGSIQWFGSGLVASQNLLVTQMEGIYEFRSRI